MLTSCPLCDESLTETPWSRTHVHASDREPHPHLWLACHLQLAHDWREKCPCGEGSDLTAMAAHFRQLDAEGVLKDHIEAFGMLEALADRPKPNFSTTWASTVGTTISKYVLAEHNAVLRATTMLKKLHAEADQVATWNIRYKR